MKKYILVSLFFVCVLACKKAGLGGDNTVAVFPQHHGKAIPSHPTWSGDPLNYRDTIYVKYNATELPGTKPGDFDRIFIGEAGEEHVHLKGLQKGKYYLYAVGWDTSISQRVKGGHSLELKELTSDIDFNVPVTE